MATLEEIRGRLLAIRRELDEVYEALEQLEDSQPVHPQPGQGGRPAGTGFTDKEALREAFEELFRQMGVEHVKPIGAVALQEMMLMAGVKPEQNLFSRGIIEMREE